MVEYRVRKIERYEVTRYSDMNNAAGVVTVASDLTEHQANDIAGAMYERSNAAGIVAKAVYSHGQELSNT